MAPWPGPTDREYRFALKYRFIEAHNTSTYQPAVTEVLSTPDHAVVAGPS